MSFWMDSVKWEIVLQVAVSLYADLQMTQLITRLSWNDPWSSTHHLAAKCTTSISPFVFLLLLAADFYAWHNILRLLNEDKQGIWHSIVPKMRTTNEHIGAGGLWPEMYGTSESHISPVVLYSIRKALFCLKRAELFLLSTTFLSFLDDGRGTFSCDDVDGILCCVICCILNDGWLLAASLAASCHRIKTSTTDRTIFQKL